MFRCVTIGRSAIRTRRLTEYDGIVLGTGHNALILQAYLCRCGLRVISLDQSAVAGGGLATFEPPQMPGFRHNTHSFFHRAITTMPWFHDLELTSHGVRYIEPELNVAMIMSDGQSLQWWTDFERTIDSFSQFSGPDARSLRRWVDEFRPIVREILLPEAQSPPLPEKQRIRLLESTSMGRRLLEVSALSPLEFVHRNFENDAVRAGLLFFNGLREVDLRLPGFGHTIPALLAGAHMAQMCVGGSARLAEGIVRDIHAHGGTVRTDVRVSRILVEGGRAVGVQLNDGERIETAGFVASGLNPQQTFLQLMDIRDVDRTTRSNADGFQYNLLAPLFALNLSLLEPPRYRAAERYPELNRAFMVILGLDRFDQFSEIVTSHEQGRIPTSVMWGASPTVFDPSQAPPDRHTAFMWEKLPYAVDGDAGNWDRIASRHGRSMLNLWAQYAPNLTSTVVVDSFVRSPRDVERTLPNMRFGDLLVGSFDHGQTGFNRPFPGAGNYRTPVRGLYLCGGSTHPGGNITGLCGYNAARVIAADASVPCWWNPPDMADQGGDPS